MNVGVCVSGRVFAILFCFCVSVSNCICMFECTHVCFCVSICDVVIACVFGCV